MVTRPGTSPTGLACVAVHRMRTLKVPCSLADEAIQSSLRREQAAVGTKGLVGHGVFEMIGAEACSAFHVVIISGQRFSTAAEAVENITRRRERHGDSVFLLFVDLRATKRWR